MIVSDRKIYPMGMIFLFSYDIFFRYTFLRVAAFNEKKDKLDTFKLNTFTVIFMFIICPGAIYFFFLNKRNYFIEYLLYIALTLLKLIMVPLRDVINDYLLSKKEVEPYKIMFFRGIVNLILMLIFTLIIFLFDFIEHFSFFNDGLFLWMLFKIALFILIIISSMSKYYNLLVTIKKYTSYPAVFSYLLLYILKYI